MGDILRALVKETVAYLVHLRVEEHVEMKVARTAGQ